MALKARLTQEEFKGLAEPLAKEYVQRDGAYVLDVSPAKYSDANGKEITIALEDVTGLKNALSMERSNVGELTQKLKAFERITDPDAALAALAKIKEWGEAGPDDKVKKQLDAAKEHLEQRFRGEITTLTTRLTTEQKEKEQLIEDTKRLVMDNAASTELTKTDVLPEALETMVREIRDQCRAKRVMVDGKVVYSVEVIDRNGNVRITNRSNSTDPMGLDELVKEMKAGRWAYAFKGTQAQGSGASTPNGTRITGDLSKLSPVERMKAARRAQVGR
jgi:hypothetical protein